MKRSGGSATRKPRQLKRNQPTTPRSSKPASSRPAPAAFPILGPVGAPQEYFPGELLNLELCIAEHGRGLANMAERGGLAPWEILANVRGGMSEDILQLPRAEAELEVSKIIGRHWKGETVTQPQEFAPRPPVAVT